jgi:hypothetical protein
MEVSGKFHAPAALFIGKEPPIPITLKAGWPPEPVWTLWRKEKKNVLPGIEPRPSHPSLVAIHLFFFLFDL